MFSAALGYMIGFASAVFAEPLRRWLFAPVLALDFNPSDTYQTRTYEGPPHSKVVTNRASYLRVGVTNSRKAIAKSCRAYLIRVDKIDETGLFRDTIYCDSLRLTWSAQPEDSKHEPLDLPHGVRQFVDLLSTRDHSADFRPELQINLRRYGDLFKDHGTYKFTILVAADGAKPRRIAVAFQWTGKWDEYKAWRA
jgi:hypothetical protein